VLVSRTRRDGIIRDQRTGIVLAREGRHPGADLFKDAPMGDGLPGMSMAPEAEHILAIHFFDNLGYPLTPPRPLYKAIPDTDSIAEVGRQHVKWVSLDTPDPAQVQAEEPILIDDISHYDADQLAAMKVQVRQLEIAQKLVDQADPQVRGEGPA
jgi:hypothetical protein